MSVPGTPEPKIVLVPGHSIPNQRWWKALHATIITSFQNKDVVAFPPTWTRLPTDPKEGAIRLKEELGDEGVLAVVLLLDRPIACAGALPFRGPNWIDSVISADENGTDSNVADDEAATADTECISTVPNQKAVLDWDSKSDWEICCFCVHPIHRKIGLSPKVLKYLIDHIKTLGAKRLVSNYVIEETGHYWPYLGFQTIPGAGGVLRKGFTHTKGMEGLRADIHFAMGIKTI